MKTYRPYGTRAQAKKMLRQYAKAYELAYKDTERAIAIADCRDALRGEPADQHPAIVESYADSVILDIEKHYPGIFHQVYPM